MDELVDLYDINHNKTGEFGVRGKPFAQGRYRLSIHIWIINSNNKIYIQRRSANRSKFPNFWENAGGGALMGESSIEAMKREFSEEIGIDPDMNNAVMFESIARNDDIVDFWLIRQDFKIEDLKLQKDEVSDAKWVSLNEFEEMIKAGLFVPTINFSFEPFKKYVFN